MLTERFREAFRFAADLHAGQTRKRTDTPYIAHLLAVAAIVIEDGGSEEEAIAALLHDAIEDQGDPYPGGRNGLRREIAERFGANVLEIVNDCTDDDHYSKAAPDARDPAVWRARKQAYIDHIGASTAASRRVSCADKLHNVRSLLTDYRLEGEKVWERFRTGKREDQLWYYNTLARVFLGGGQTRLTGELDRVVDDLHKQCGVSRGAVVGF